MYTEWNRQLDSTRADLVAAISLCEERARVGREAEAKKQKYQEMYDRANDTHLKLIALSNHMTDIYKNIKSYAIEHKKKVKTLVDLAISEAGEMVPDADASGIHLEVSSNGKVHVLNGEDSDVNVREGSGYRAILGAFMRYASIKSDPEALQFMVFDEYFFPLSDLTTEHMRDLFERMKKDMSLVVTEQRRNVMAGITDREYLFEKIAPKHSIVREVTGEQEE